MQNQTSNGAGAGPKRAFAVSVGVEHWPLAKPFAIARGVKTEAVTVVVRVSDGALVGLGEATPYARYGETVESVQAEIESVADLVSAPLDDGSLAQRRAAVAARLKPGAALNAVDCALWDLEARRAGTPVSVLAGLSPPDSVITAVTISLDTPEAMAQAAQEAVTDLGATLLKAKLGSGDAAGEAERLEAIRAAAPDARLIVDANEGWTPELLATLDPVCASIGALFIEQPLPADQDAALDGLGLVTPLCADESCHTLDDLERLAGRFRVVNIKLDKTGGLTGAIALREAALAQGFDVMVGCMVAGSLAMAPAYLLTAGALAVDLDGPLLLANDRPDAILYEGARMFPPGAALWGG